MGARAWFPSCAGDPHPDALTIESRVLALKRFDGFSFDVERYRIKGIGADATRRKALEADQQQYLPLLLWQLTQRAIEIAEPQRRALGRGHRQDRRHIVHGHIDALAHGAPDIIHVLIVENGEKPGAEVGAGLPQMRFRQRAGETALHKVIGADRIARQRASIAAQPGNLRFEKLAKSLHWRLPLNHRDLIAIQNLNDTCRRTADVFM